MNIQRYSLAHYKLAKSYIDKLAMPVGALGDLQELICQLAAIYREVPLSSKRKALVLSAGDHGVVKNSVSKYPQITGAIVKTALNGGAAINAFCKSSNCDLHVIDTGLVEDVDHHELIKNFFAKGTNDFTKGPAMERQVCEKVIQAGIDYALSLNSKYDVLALGEMGIGNTTASAAIASVICQESVELMTGRGTGVDDSTLVNKIICIQKAIKLNQPEAADGIDVLAKVGGFELAFMSGLILGWSSLKKAIVLDGFITGASALAAFKINRNVKDYLIAGHLSAEKGHKKVLEFLSLKPVCKLKMRLGEGIGAALACKTIDSVIETMTSMMTLDEALKL